MIRALLLKELHDHLVSLRFQVGFLLALGLVSGSAFVLSNDYRRASEDYYQRLRRENEFIARYAHLNRAQLILNVSRPPVPLLLVRGLPHDAGAEVLEANPMPDLFAPLDLTSIVAVIFSLFGIVLGFDAVTGERERGTLRLVLANSLRHFHVLAAKWAAGMLVLALALLAALLAGAGILFALSGARWDGQDWLSFLAICACSLLYPGAFFSLALLVSTLARRSSVAVLASVFAWVLLVLVLPNLCPYVAAQFARVPSRGALERDLQYITSEERDQVGDRLAAQVREKYPSSADFASLDSPGGQRRLAADPEFRKRYDQYRKEIEAAWNEANRLQRAKAHRIEEAYTARTNAQFRLSQEISYGSPLPPFIYASTELALTGFESRKGLSEQMETFRDGPLDEYLGRRYREEQRKNPAFGWNDFLDISGRPRFLYTPPPFRERLALVLPYAGVLAAWNLCLFAAAMAGFLRFDVR